MLGRYSLTYLLFITRPSRTCAIATGWVMARYKMWRHPPAGSMESVGTDGWWLSDLAGCWNWASDLANGDPDGRRVCRRSVAAADPIQLPHSALPFVLSHALTLTWYWRMTYGVTEHTSLSGKNARDTGSSCYMLHCEWVRDWNLMLSSTWH